MSIPVTAVVLTRNESRSIDACLVSETDILDGVALDVMRAPDQRAR